MAMQSTYATRHAVGYPGMIADLGQADIVTRIIETAAVGFGVAVVQGTTDKGAKFATALAAASAAKSGGNTGNGTLTLDATTPVLAGAKVGVYTVRLITAATNAGTFRVEDPDGNVLGDVAVGGTFSDDIKFATADGSTDFAVGDGFDITVSGGGVYVGVTVRDQSIDVASVDAYPVGANAAVLLKGTIWVTVGATVVAGDPAYFVPATGVITNVAAGNISIPNARFETGASSGALAKLRLR